MGKLLKDNWTGSYYEQQINGKWRNMGMYIQDTPVDTIEYTLLPSTLKGGRFTEIRPGTNMLLLII